MVGERHGLNFRQLGLIQEGHQGNLEFYIKEEEEKKNKNNKNRPGVYIVVVVPK